MLLCIDILYNKDRSIKAMDRLIKESAFDCSLVYNRNVQSTMIEGSSKCDYGPCAYRCDGIVYDAPPFLDLSTYQLYYSPIDAIEKKLIDYFKTHNSATLNTLMTELDTISMFSVMEVLAKMVNNNVEISRPTGISFLREYNNTYTLVSNVNDITDQFDTFYSEHDIQVRKSPFFQVADRLYQYSLGTFVDEIGKSQDVNEIQRMLKSLPLFFQEIFVEAAVKAKYENIGSLLRDVILSIYKDSIKDVNNIIVSVLNADGIRCFIDGKWKGCPENIKETLTEKLTTRAARIQQYPYHGFVKDGDFYIARRNESNIQDKRKRREGAKCVEGGWSKNDLILLCMDERIEPPNDYLDTQKTNPKIEEARDWSEEEISRIRYWSKQTKIILCNTIQKWFEKNDLIL